MKNQNEEEVHYGKEVRKRLKEYGMSIAEFSRRINRCRSDIYDIFKRKYIDLNLLNAISEVLKYDFIHKRNLH